MTSLLPSLLFGAGVEMSAAIAVGEEGTGASTTDLLFMSMGLFIFCALFIFIAYRIFNRKGTRTKSHRMKLYAGIALAIIGVGSGTILLTLATMVFVTILTDITGVDYVVEAFSYYFQEDITFGLIVTAGTGAFLFLLGFNTIVYYMTSEVVDSSMREKVSYHIRREVVEKTENENGKTAPPRRNKISYRVFSWETGKPVPDAKVVLAQENGVVSGMRYTDFHGEVVFEGMEGIPSDYSAYVDGDPEKEKYRVIRL